MRTLHTAAAALLAGFALVAEASAQCLGPDGLAGGPCCTNTTPNAPRVPNFVQDSLSICWQDCDVDAISVCEAAWSSTKPGEGQSVGWLRVSSEWSRVPQRSSAVGV